MLNPVWAATSPTRDMVSVILRDTFSAQQIERDFAGTLFAEALHLERITEWDREFSLHRE